ncbi:glycerophosphodiester phosphodiesterase family protein [Fervidobacterium thailandense]|uniref:Glycerophosphodiester phosphodiesterase n=1 Tax=Fervidobacterium thailandense TaxID=1008305 RepID=A0A1E3G4P7_9BACT|nr:glycerophosphodiester phosphodiesterase family protein [Fervidobacterium thailandense]ODN31209.1 glycerophosphodiester phosphodiesterase [Fervidobacterium thailandense]
MKILGHRGLPRLYPENTMKSFLAALSYGADGLETDVRLTADGIPVLIHDADLLRLAGEDVEVGELKFKELKDFNVGGEPIPTLEEFLSAIPPGKWINLEIKEPGAGEVTVEFALSHYDGQLIFSSFEHQLINELKRKYPNAKFGYLFDERHENLTLDEVRDLFREHTFSAHLPIEFKILDSKRFSEMCNLVKSLNLKLVLWTVNEPALISDIKELVDFVITDDVRLFL